MAATDPPKAPPAPSIGTVLQADIPIIIPCFNAVTYARGMVEQLRGRGFRHLILLDNASTYPPMLEFLAAPGRGVTVVAQPDNKGPRDVLLDPIGYALLPQYFCLTDPDLRFAPDMPVDFVARLAALTDEFSIGKAGLALDIADRDAMRSEDFIIGDQPWKIWDWEAKFWTDRVDSACVDVPIYRAPVDTTFAVYNKRYFDRGDPLHGVRVAGPFTCRHLPWYKDNGLPPDEESFYRAHARDSFYLPPVDDDRTRKVRYETPVALTVEDAPGAGDDHLAGPPAPPADDPASPPSTEDAERVEHAPPGPLRRLAGYLSRRWR